MIKSITPRGRPIDTEIRVPGSKSITNRALICAALAGGESVLQDASDSTDTLLMVNGLNQLGILVRKDGSDFIVEGKGGRVYAPRFPIPVGNAGTTLRFLMGLGALADGPVVFEGSGRMSERPIQPLIDALRELGTESEALDFAARYAVRGGSFHGGTARVVGDLSSQFLSALLMVAPYARTDVRLEPQGTVSDPYISMTMEVMKRFQIEAEHESGGPYSVRSGGRYRPGTMEIEADFSSAAIFFCAAMITGGQVRIRVKEQKSMQGDFGILAILGKLGGNVRTGQDHIVLSSDGAGSYSGIDINMRDMPDLVPCLVSALLFADSPSRIRGVEHLRFKESDRLEGLCAELHKLGASIQLKDDGVEIDPAPLTGAKLNPHDDHRLAMSFAIIGLKVPGISIENPECVGKSFPGFWGEMKAWEGAE